MKKRAKISPEVNLTPLIDIVFLLLVFFMLTAHFVKNEKIELELPKSSSASKLDEKILEIFVDKEKKISFLGAEISKKDLQTRLSEILSKREKKEVVLNGDKSIPLETLIALMDVCRLSGATSVSIKTEK